MHYVAILRISTENVWDYLTESFWENTFVDVLDSVMDIFLRCRNSTLHIPLVAHIRSDFL